ncbi:MAG: hypothetical protein ACHQIO_19180 [Nevskiales bacterium]
MWDQMFKSVLPGLFFPTRIATPRAMSIPAAIFIGSLLLTAIVLAEPTIRNLVTADVFEVTCLPAAYKDAAKGYCDFAAIVLQILIAVVIGGIAITDRTVRLAQGLALSFERQREQRLSYEQRRLIREMYAIYLRSRATARGITLRMLLAKFATMMRDSHRIYRIAGHRLPIFYMTMITLRFGPAFPGGLHGVIAFVLFEGLLSAQVVKTYFDYVAPCQL